MTRKYLILDDNAAFAENLAEIVSEEGDEVRFTTEGEQALRWVERERFDAVLTDMRMPNLSGAQFLNRIRRIDPEVPAIAITAFTADEELAHARSEGLLGVFGKPVPLGPLLDLLARARRGGIVALVEDDEALADNLSEALAGSGLTAVTAHSVLETDRFAHLQPFAAIVDLRVPGGPDGEAMRRLHERFPEMPLVVISGAASCELPKVTRAQLRKPFSTRELLGVIEQVYREAHG